MAYVESFVYFVLFSAVVMVVLGIVFVGFYLIVGEIRLLFAKEDGPVYLSIGSKKLKLLKHHRKIANKEAHIALLSTLWQKKRWFKVFALLYTLVFLSFYIHRSLDYYGAERAYPRAKSYAIVADTVFLWESVLINIRWNRGLAGVSRLVYPYEGIDVLLQDFQSHLLEKMYQYIPQDDAERDMHYYKYKQLIMAKIRYYPLVDDEPRRNMHMMVAIGHIKPSFRPMMDKMHEVSRNLHKKSIQDKVFDRDRYLPIAQMAYYLEIHISDYATLEHSLTKYEMLYNNPALFEKTVYAYHNFLYDVLQTLDQKPYYMQAMDKHPFSYALLLRGSRAIIFYVHRYLINRGVDVCKHKVIEQDVYYAKKIYRWLHDSNSSFFTMNKHDKDQIYSLLSFAWGLAIARDKYICGFDFPFQSKEEKAFDQLLKNPQKFEQAKALFMNTNPVNPELRKIKETLPFNRKYYVISDYYWRADLYKLEQIRAKHTTKEEKTWQP